MYIFIIAAASSALHVWQYERSISICPKSGNTKPLVAKWPCCFKDICYLSNAPHHCVYSRGRILTTSATYSLYIYVCVCVVCGHCHVEERLCEFIIICLPYIPSHFFLSVCKERQYHRMRMHEKEDKNYHLMVVSDCVVDHVEMHRRGKQYPKFRYTDNGNVRDSDDNHIGINSTNHNSLSAFLDCIISMHKQQCISYLIAARHRSTCIMHVCPENILLCFINVLISFCMVSNPMQCMHGMERQAFILAEIFVPVFWSTKIVCNHLLDSLDLLGLG